MHRSFDKLKGVNRELKVLEFKAAFFLQFIADDANDVLIDMESIAKENNNLPVKKASYIVALALAKQCRPLEDGIFFKNLVTDVLSCFGEKCYEAVRLCQNIPLSRNTITRRTEEISQFIHFAAKKRLQNCKYFSLSLDESTDINNICQLMICIKTVDENLTCFEEIFELVSLHGHVTGQVLYEAIDSKIFTVAEKSKLSSICTDGAKVMRGKTKGLLGLLKKNNINCLAFHCVIHQQALFCKSLSMSNTMNIAVKIINKIRGGHNSLTHRKFKEFLDNLNADYGDLLLYTEVRWLSRGKSLERLFNLRKDVITFLKTKPNNDTIELITAMENPEFLLDLAFLCDITAILNELNLTLQGKDMKIFKLATTIHNFYRKLTLLTDQLLKNNFVSLKRTSFIFTEFNINTFEKIQNYAEIIKSLKLNYEGRFEDLKHIVKLIELHDFPLVCEIEEHEVVLQEELKNLRNDLEIPLETGEQFWKSVDDRKYPNLKDEIYKLYSMFGTTYNCEVAFSSLKIILNKIRNRISDNHVADLLRIKEYRGDINLDELAKG